MTENVRRRPNRPSAHECGHAAATAVDARGWSSPGGPARPPARRSSTPPPSCSPPSATPTPRPDGSPTPSGCGRPRCTTTSPPRTTSSTRCWPAPSTSRCGWPPNCIAETGPAAPRLHALVVGDVTQLCDSTLEPGRALPAARTARGPFRASSALRRAELRDALPRAGRRGHRRVRRARRRRRTAVPPGRVGDQPPLR